MRFVANVVVAVAAALFQSPIKTPMNFFWFSRCSLLTTITFFRCRDSSNEDNFGAFFGCSTTGGPSNEEGPSSEGRQNPRTFDARKSSQTRIRSS
jgi:hypothetical protein